MSNVHGLPEDSCILALIPYCLGQLNSLLVEKPLYLRYAHLGSLTISGPRHTLRALSEVR